MLQYRIHKRLSSVILLKSTTLGGPTPPLDFYWDKTSKGQLLLSIPRGVDSQASLRQLHPNCTQRPIYTKTEYQPIRPISRFYKLLMVGMRGFEPPTPCPPDRCATKLRYIPTCVAYVPLLDFAVNRSCTKQ